MSTERLREFVHNMTQLVSRTDDEPALLEAGGRHLTELVRQDDWLPERFAEPHPERYMQYLLHCDPLERFSVVSFVWGPSQTTPVHDHTVWGLIGMLRGQERCEEFGVTAAGKLERGDAHGIEPGEVDRVSPTIGDIHRVSNALSDRASISIHVYGGNIGSIRRHVFDEASGSPSDFVSGYSSDLVPNIWG